MTTEDSGIPVGSTVVRPWGKYVLVERGEDYSVKILYINPGETTSLQCHSKRHEMITLLDGTMIMTHHERTFSKDRSQRASSYRVLAGEWHRFAAPARQRGYTVLLEIAYGELDPDDFLRREDKYNRVRTEGSGFVEKIIDNTYWRR